MANTWTALFADVAIGTANKSMADIWNPSGSARIIKVHKIYALNNVITAVSGGINTFQIAKITALSVAGTEITPVKHDTTQENWSSNTCSAHYASTVTEGDVFCTFCLSSDEATVRGVVDFDYWSKIHSLSLVWNIGSYDSGFLQPIIIRPDQGLHIKFVSGTASVGVLTTIIEFTTEAE